MSKKRILIVYYSFSSQTQLLIQRLVSGMNELEVNVEVERLQPVKTIHFPFSTWLSMIKVMVFSFFRWRVPTRPVDHLNGKKWDLVLLAGPTWSYSPSGPILYFLDTYGREIVSNTEVQPLISCRAYWRTHYWCLKTVLKQNGATVLSPIVYQHASVEPWRTIGLVLQIMGRMPRLESSWFRKHYPRYGHSKEQFRDAVERGRQVAATLLGNE